MKTVSMRCSEIQDWRKAFTLLLSNELKYVHVFCYYRANGSMIMSDENVPLKNHVKSFHEDRGWSQQ